jgi:hypothetical protein
MANAKVMALIVTMMALTGLGAATTSMPAVSEVSAQGNMTGNMTGDMNMTDAAEGSGNISDLLAGP